MIFLATFRALHPDDVRMCMFLSGDADDRHCTRGTALTQCSHEGQLDDGCITFGKSFLLKTCANIPINGLPLHRKISRAFGILHSVP